MATSGLPDISRRRFLTGTVGAGALAGCIGTIEDYEEEIQATRDDEEDAPAIPDPDVHGIGVRPTADYEGETSPPY